MPAPAFPADLTTPIEPLIFPNYIVCDASWGQGLVGDECRRAANQLPRSSTAWPYPTNPSARWALPLFRFPMSINFGDCYISIETAGINIPTVILLIPNNLRLLSSSVIQECVDGEGGIGGYSTYRLDQLANWIGEPGNDINANTPPDRAFLTVSVSGSEKKNRQPGDRDPAIPLVLSDIYKKLMDRAVPGSTAYRSAFTSSFLYRSIAQEGYLTDTTWWNVAISPTQQSALEASNKMTYECDAGLGSPSTVDCTKLEWSELGVGSDTVKVAPGVVTFLHQGTCNLAITATTALVLTWEQIRAAVSTLLSICVDNPYDSSQGGRAFYGAPPMTASNRRIRKRQISGLDALPPGANMTVFEQTEPWTSPEAELQSCTWKAISKRLSIKTCSA